MSHLPTALFDFCRQNLIEPRQPAYLLFDQDGNLSRWGGPLSTYGCKSLSWATPAREAFPVLEGAVPSNGRPATLPAVEIRPGIHVDVHIVPSDEGDWALLLDARANVEERRRCQQLTNELSLLRRSVQRDGLSESVLPSNLLGLLEIAVLERTQDGYENRGHVPEWMARLDESADPDVSSPAELFPFLENFLEDAEGFWERRPAGRLRSGPWTETLENGTEIPLEASACNVDGREILLINPLGEAYAEKQDLLQKAREQSLIHHRLLEEVEQKEILLHCIVHDLGGPLTGIRAGLELLSREGGLSSKGDQRLRTIQEAAFKLERLIRDFVDVFSSDKPTTDDQALAADLGGCARTVVETLVPAATLDRVRLKLDPGVNWDDFWVVKAHSSKLERVLFNLVENALRHTPADGRVVVSLDRRGENCRCYVDDEGPGVPDELSSRLFKRFAQGGESSGKAGLGLYFCRIMVEAWGGQIGYSSRHPTGSRFWFELPPSR